MSFQLRSVKRRECAQASVRRDVHRADDLVVPARDLHGELRELLSRELVLFGFDRRQTAGARELGGHHGFLHVGHLSRFGYVVLNLREVLGLDADAYDVQAHVHDVPWGGAVVAGAYVALERGVEVASRVVKVP